MIKIVFAAHDATMRSANEEGTGRVDGAPVPLLRIHTAGIRGTDEPGELRADLDRCTDFHRPKSDAP